MSILVINAGSTSLRFGLFGHEGLHELKMGSIDWSDGNRSQAQLVASEEGHIILSKTVSVASDQDAIRIAIETIGLVNPPDTIRVAAHRVVHGGTIFSTPAFLTNPVRSTIRSLFKLAPLHNPPALAAVEAVEQNLPKIPQIAVFDTAFFSKLPPSAFVYPIPFEWPEQWGIRRFGFHGISNAYCLARATEMLGVLPRRLITCHLGGGCSATAVFNGQPIATTMGFNPLDGFMMGPRNGSLDPGLMLHLQSVCGIPLDQLSDALHNRSGLYGVSGISSDLGRIQTAAENGNARAQLVFNLFCDRFRAAIGALAVQMGGVDTLVFTDRNGDNSVQARWTICRGLECLGIQVDRGLNSQIRPDADISSKSSSARVYVIRSREEQMIAREAHHFLNHQAEKENNKVASSSIPTPSQDPDPLMKEQRN